jgi:hypothetical protein
MKHQTAEQLLDRATIVDGPMVPMTRRERIERWATLLDRHGGALTALYRIEYLSPEERRLYRGSDNTPLAVAYRDPVLRRDGLAGDTLGDAMDYFGINDWEAHRLLCDCHYFGAMTGKGLAARLRRQAAGGLKTWVVNFFTSHVHWLA